LFKNEENFCYYFVYKAADKYQLEYGQLPGKITIINNNKKKRAGNNPKIY
jgi:hypothetical protein